MTANTVARRDDAILIVVDEQERLASIMERRASVASATEKLVRTAGLLGVPVIVTRQYPKGLGESEAGLVRTLADVEAAGADVTHVDKVAFDCFREPQFAYAVTTIGREQLVIVGMETHICIAQTVLSALRAGFDVHVVADACCSRDEANHQVALDRLRGAGAVVTTCESVMYEFVGEAGTDEFKALLAIVKS